MNFRPVRLLEFDPFNCLPRLTVGQAEIACAIQDAREEVE